MSSCLRRLSPKRTGPSRTPIGASSASARAHPPRGQARPDWQIICDLALRIESRLGRPTAKWDYASPEEVLREMASVNSDYAGITYERIDKVGLIYPVPDLNHPGTPTLFKEAFPRGRGKFIPLDYVPCDGGAGRRVSVHPDDGARARALARRHHDAQLGAR